MKPAAFDYLAPDSLEAALAALEETGYDAKLLAGGQSLIPAMNFRVMAPAVLIDLNRIDSLAYIREGEAGSLRIGAMTRQRTIERSELVALQAPLLSETMPFIAHLQIRNRGTLGGSLAHADPAAELPVIALTLGARIKAVSISGERWISADDFFPFMFSTDLQPGEILTEIEFPAMPQRSGWAFEEFARRKGDYAMAGIAALLVVDENGICTRARLGCLNLGDRPMLAEGAQALLEGERPGPAVIAAAAEQLQREVEPAGNVHATPPYQRHLAKILSVRALTRALKRAMLHLDGRNGHA